MRGGREREKPRKTRKQRDLKSERRGDYGGYERKTGEENHGAQKKKKRNFNHGTHGKGELRGREKEGAEFLTTKDTKKNEKKREPRRTRKEAAGILPG